MGSLNCDFEFDSIESDLEKLNHHKNLLWVLHADKIPPHIGISTQGQFFSLKVGGKDEYLPTIKLIDFLNFKRIPSVVIELNSNKNLNEIAQKFEQFDRAKDLKSSCLIPIKDLFISDQNVNQLKDFLGFLDDNKLINQVFGLNLKQTYKGIPHYTTDEIESRLEKLKHVKR